MTNKDHWNTGITHLPNQLQHFGGLRHAEGGGRLVHDDDLACPHDRTRHGYALALSARQRD
jgi:hypothetical protein